MILNEKLANKKPMVSISMLTYNHENYIEQAIKSVLMQEVDFDYQLIIGEDCSTDNTRNIVIKYAQSYPDKIIAILHDKNVGMKENTFTVRKFLTGKYIALLEGDDCWLDKSKLFKQVHFLEENTQYYAVAHKHYEIDNNGNRITGIKLLEYNSGYTNKKIYTLKEFAEYYLSAHTSTIVYRNFFYKLTSEEICLYDNCSVVGDRKLNLILAALGGVYKLDEYMSAYRHHGKSWTEQKYPGGLAFYGYKAMNDLEKLAMDMFEIKINFKDAKLRAWYGTCFALIKNFNKENYDAVLTIFNNGNKFQKILFLLTHTLSFPFRKL